jgi:hypothetical protein
VNVEQLIKVRGKNDYCVYWGSPNATEDGSLSLATPVEINCMWHDTSEVFKDKNGKEKVSRAKVFVTQDIDDEGILYHGRLDDLTAAQKSNPLILNTAFEIAAINKVPQLSSNTNVYARKIML